MKTIILFSFFIISTLALPGVRVSVNEQYINSFLQQQLPSLIPKNITINEIAKNTTHSNFLANITNISITQINLDYLNSKVSFNEKENKMALKLTNLNVNINLDYLFRALFFETSGVFSLMNNITVNLEISSSFDSRTQKPNISISSFSVEYHTFNILFGGSIFGYLLDIIEGFCECVVKEQYPNLLQTFLDMSLQKIVSDINYKYLVDLNFTEVGLDIALPQEIENKADHLNIYLNALFYDPYSPYENPPQPTNLPIYNESHRGIEIAINQGTINSFLWALNHQEIFDILIKGDDLPIQLPFPLEINTKLFELALPELYTYYDSNKIIDLQLNSSKDNSPLISFAENYSSILLKINESITFLVRTDENIHDEAFTVNFLFDIQLNCSLNQTFLMFNVLNIRIDNSELVKNKIPNLQIQGLTQLINSTLNIAIGLLNVYLNENPISVPEIKGVKLDNLELLIKKDNLILAVEPTIYELYPESIKTVVKKLGKTLNMVKI